MARILIGVVLSFLIGAACRYFDIPAASPAVIPGAIIVLAMTLGYSSMDRVVSRRQHAATTKSFCGGPTGLPIAITRNAGSDKNLPGRVQGDPHS
jgi:XapX domain-containing protein